MCIRRGCAGALLNVIGRIFHFFVMVSETPKLWACLGVNLHLELKILPVNPKARDPRQYIWLNSAGDQMV